MSYERSERIRRAAILVASVEETVAEQMLAALPRAEAARIRAEVELLDEVDVDEQQDVLEEFRRAGRQASAAEHAVEFTYSASQVAAAPVIGDGLPAPGPAQVTDKNDNAAADEALLMAELLVEEHPQTVAAALSRLNHEQGAAVFAALPPSLQTEVVDRLANLQPADEDAVQELQTQLEQRVQRHRERRERAAAGAELARKILAKTPPAQQMTLLARLSPASELPSGRSEWSGASVQAQELAGAIQRSRGVELSSDEGSAPADGSQAWDDEPLTAAESNAEAAELNVEDCSRELERLSDGELLDALRVADEQTVQRALAVSSESFLNRVAGKLPRRHAARLRKAVRAIGPATLAELRAAQNELLRLARDRDKELAA